MCKLRLIVWASIDAFNERVSERVVSEDPIVYLYATSATLHDIRELSLTTPSEPYYRGYALLNQFTVYTEAGMIVRKYGSYPSSHTIWQVV